MPDPSVSPPTEETPLVPDYIYTTDQSVEDFNRGRVKQPRNNLSPPEPYIPSKPPPPIADPENPATYNYCKKHPEDPRCNDEQDPYNDLGLFQKTEKKIFNPERRSDEITKKSIKTKYESKQDDTQFDPPTIIRQECRCKDGTIALGYLDTTTGQRDCSPCRSRTRAYSNPSIYKNYKTKKPQTNFRNKKIPLREQAGVSNFGDVNLNGCPTGTTTRSIEVINQNATLNKVTNIDTKDSVGGSKITVDRVPITSNTGLPTGCSLYDDCKTNVYGI